jgi:acyl dehydratase
MSPGTRGAPGDPGASTPAAAAIAPAIAGMEFRPHRTAIDARWLMAYAAAAGAHQPACFDTAVPGGPLAHPLFPVCYEWPLLLEIRARVIAAEAAPFGVHASHRLAVHRLPRAGDELTSTARVTAVVERRAGVLVMVRLVTRDAAGGLVSETDYGSLYRGVALAGPATGQVSAGSSGERIGPSRDAPGTPGVPAPRWTEQVEVPYHLAHVYTECARIWNPIHTDVAVARSAGLPGPILHGTATLALAVSRILARDLGGDCRAVRRIEARFTGMVPLPSTFTVRAGARDARGIAFEAVGERGAPVLSEGVLGL